ncbi:MAG: glycosyltransferase family 1 protein [Roseofilum sp. Belize BBD 4]|nr:glycosyltransferase family 1 protein [Roseofilum sp. Belize Diploria]MBP0032630.1 glycosyltransferase family 1 protein [Roseofilum sp. Belize BBD 4]HBR00923.1 group 1 glycosyl transferase [Cyanobacteria bacterium UBA11691]
MKKIKAWVKQRLPNLQTLYKKIMAKTWSPHSIVYYTGNHHEGLTPNSLKTGASGSHAAVIYLAREWVKLGYQVTVYSNCGDQEGLYDGVEYVNYYKFNWCDRFDTVIIWRHSTLLQHPINAKNLWLDWHDTLGPAKAFTTERLEPFDKIFSKSHYQRQLLPQFNDDKFVVINNGVSEDISPLYNTPKTPYKLIYGSRYYRGLEYMLTYGWPIIKQEIPEAELHLFYGFTKRDNHPKHSEWRKKMIDLMNQPGVFDRGRVSQDKILEEKAKSLIHYYGCTYPEIDCISVRESAMVGCIPVMTDLAALGEKSYGIKVSGDPESQETQEAVAYKVIELMREDPEKLQLIREQFQQLAQEETWGKVAPIWLKNQYN